MLRQQKDMQEALIELAKLSAEKRELQKIIDELEEQNEEQLDEESSDVDSTDDDEQWKFGIPPETKPPHVIVKHQAQKIAGLHGEISELKRELAKKDQLKEEREHIHQKVLESDAETMTNMQIKIGAQKETIDKLRDELYTKQELVKTQANLIKIQEEREKSYMTTINQLRHENGELKRNQRKEEMLLKEISTKEKERIMLNKTIEELCEERTIIRNNHEILKHKNQDLENRLLHACSRQIGNTCPIHQR